VRFRKLAALALALGCAGCGSGIDITHASWSDKPLTGVPWNLAMTQFKLTITRQIDECDGTIKGSVVVAAPANKVLDEQQKYLLDSTGLWATSDITSTLGADGTSTGLNAQSQDATGQVIANVVSLAAEGATFAGGMARPLGARIVAPPRFTCSTDVEAAFKDMKPPGKPSLQKQVTADTAALSAATVKVTLLTSQASKDRSYNRLLAKALGEQAAAQAVLTKDQNRLTNDMNAVTDIQTVNWPQLANQFRTDVPFTLSNAAVNKWIKFPVPPPGSQPPQLSGNDEVIFNVSLALYRAMDDGSWASPPAPAVGDISVGIPVRVPRLGRLLVCTGACEGNAVFPPTLPSGWVALDSHTRATDQPVLQLGQMYNVRVRGGMFKSEGAMIALDPTTGQPTSIEVSEKAAAVAVATGAASGAATTVAGVPGAIAAIQLARAQTLSAQITARNAQIAYQAALPTAATTAEAQGQTALLNAQTALASAQANAQNAGPAAALAAQTSLLTAQNTLTGLQANAQNTNQVDALGAQTTLLNAQAAQINAQVALTGAQATLP
jgi:hypothetical protein